MNWKVFTNNIQIAEMVQQIPSLKVFNGLEEQLAKVIQRDTDMAEKGCASNFMTL